MVPCVRLIFTILAIFNYLGIVSSQDAIEHGLAIDCDVKCMKTVFQTFLKSMTRFVGFLGDICGDKCLNHPLKCACGDDMFDYSDELYCCIPRNETCEIQGMKYK